MSNLQDILKQYQSGSFVPTIVEPVEVCAFCDGLGVVQFGDSNVLSACPECSKGASRTRLIEQHKFNDTELPADYRSASLDNWMDDIDSRGKLLAYGAMLCFAQQSGKLSSHDIARLLVDNMPEFAPRLNPVLDTPEIIRYGAVLSGQLGVGKTHLAAAALNDLRQSGHRVRFLRLQSALINLSSTWKRDSAESAGQVIARYQSVPYLLIDDFQSGDTQPHAWQRGYVEDIIRHRVQERLPLLITTNLTEAQFNQVWGEWITDVILAHCEWITVGGEKTRKTAQTLKGLDI
ncbi:MAG: ATP-binding protein [Aggregatilineales bacterium]